MFTSWLHVAVFVSSTTETGKVSFSRGTSSMFWTAPRTPLWLPSCCYGSSLPSNNQINRYSQELRQHTADIPLTSVLCHTVLVTEDEGVVSRKALCKGATCKSVWRYSPGSVLESREPRKEDGAIMIQKGVGAENIASPGHAAMEKQGGKMLLQRYDEGVCRRVPKMEVDVNGESRSALTTLPLPVAEASSPGKAEAEKPRCSSTPCSPMRRTVSGYQILHMDSNYLVGFTTGEELLKLAQKCTGAEESKGEAVPSLLSKQLDVGLARSSRLYKTRSRYYQPYEIPAVNGRRRRRMPSSGDKCTKSLPYEPYKALHGPLPLCLLKGKRAHSKSLDYLNLDKMNIKEPADTEVLQYQLQHLTLRGDRVFARNNT
ncbi:hypothetical protein MJG53_007882 [Ovis ammon polii x Ovis aries]|uniref:Uncharacterized protein n=1 Tax=Ovis ammon polii x Ovis aries TaxID=2918886 RepID=A0ACB9V4M1_9CETA|nr:hypothetical protein MJG53_007882 [Ovis ammon polii x Ovis aries]